MTKTLILTATVAICSCIFAFPVKSMLGANGTMPSYDEIPENPTAKDYIQNGLVVLMDGIENVGWGLHDPNPDIWVNLVNPNVLGYDLRNDTTSPRLYFNENAICRDTAKEQTKSLRYKGFSSFPVHAELVACLTANWTYANIITWENANGLTLSANYAIKISGNLATAPSFRVPSQQSFSASFYCARHNSTSLDDYLAYVNNEQVSLTSISSYIGTDYKIFDRCAGEINCLRLYNRQLSPEEIAYNYEIDKRRFNLP